MDGSVSVSTTFIQIEIFQQLLDGLPWDFAHAVTISTGWILMSSVIHRLFLTFNYPNIPNVMAPTLVQTFTEEC